MPVMQKIKEREEVKGSCRAIAHRSRPQSKMKSNICRMIRQTSLDELLEVSAYIDKMIHGEVAQLPDNPRAKFLATKILRIKRFAYFKEIISELNCQIIIKNRNNVNPESAEKSYIEFTNAE